MRTGAASAVGARRHNENDVTIYNNSWLMEIWRLATCGYGLHRSSIVYALAGGAWFQKHSIRQLQNDKLTK